MGEETEKQIRRLQSLINYIVLFVSHLNCTATATAAVSLVAEPKNESEEEEKMWFVLSVVAQSQFNNCAR